jgi:lysophospholipase L1-like esterase
MFFGDSISCQWWGTNTTFVEAYLRSRLPATTLSVCNVSWPGDSATKALARFNRDVLRVRPTLVVTGFGMNDGIRYERRAGISLSMLDTFRESQQGILRAIGGMKARALVLTPSCADYRASGQEPLDDPRIPEDWAPQERYIPNNELNDFPRYNGTLGMFADVSMRLGNGAGVRVVDVFRTMMPLQGALRAWPTRPSLTCDSIHPTVAGYLVMAYAVLREIAAPRVAASMAFDGANLVRATPGTVQSVAPTADGFGFRLRPAFLPFYVIPEARLALRLIPFESELNVFTLKVINWTAPTGLVYADDRLIARTNRTELEFGLDLALLRGAPWSARSLALQAATTQVGHAFVTLWQASLPADIPRSEDDRLPNRPTDELSPAPDGFSTFMRPIKPITAETFLPYAAESQALSRLAHPGSYQVSLRVHDPLLTPSERPVRLEGWESDNAKLWFAVGNSATLDSISASPSQGAQGLRMRAHEAAPVLLGVATACWPALNFGAVHDIAVDVRAAAPRAGLAMSLTLRAGVHLGRTAAVRVHPTANGWTTATFPLASLTWTHTEDAAVSLERIGEFGFSLESVAKEVLPTVIDLDNARVTR